MIVLIDGYNVLKQISSAGHISSSQRRAFINRLHSYAATHGHEVILVFDGTMSDEDFVKKQHGVTVMYSGHQLDADTVLKRLCQRYKGFEAVLVSSDRDVCAYASLCRIPCLDAVLFERLLTTHKQQASSGQAPTTQTVKSSGAAHKRAGHGSNQEIDDIMQQASRVMVIKHEDGTPSREKSPQTMSKKDKKLKKLVNKL